LKLENLFAFVLPFVIFSEQEFCLPFLATWLSPLGFIADRLFAQMIHFDWRFLLLLRENLPFIDEGY
jgi:hypothetical protein